MIKIKFIYFLSGQDVAHINTRAILRNRSSQIGVVKNRFVRLFDLQLRYWDRYCDM